MVLLIRLQEEYAPKFIWVELGLQTIHQQTADYIRRGYPLSCFVQAVKNLSALEIPVIVHMILGLPGETDDMVYESIQFLNTLPVFGIKLQLLHILKNTDLEQDYVNHIFQELDFPDKAQHSSLHFQRRSATI